MKLSQIQRIRAQIEGVVGSPLARAISRVMDECEAAVGTPQKQLTMAQICAMQDESDELLNILHGGRPCR